MHLLIEWSMQDAPFNKKKFLLMSILKRILHIEFLHHTRLKVIIIKQMKDQATYIPIYGCMCKTSHPLSKTRPMHPDIIQPQKSKGRKTRQRDFSCPNVALRKRKLQK